MTKQKEIPIPWPTVSITVLRDYAEDTNVPTVAVRLEAQVSVPNDARKIWDRIDKTLATPPRTAEDESLRDIYHLLVPQPSASPNGADLRGLAMLQVGLGQLGAKREAAKTTRSNSDVAPLGGWPIFDRITGTDGTTHRKFDPADRRFFRIHMDIHIRPNKVRDVEDAIASGDGNKACLAILENRVGSDVSAHATALVEAAFGVLKPIEPSAGKSLSPTQRSAVKR